MILLFFNSFELDGVVNFKLFLGKARVTNCLLVRSTEENLPFLFFNTRVGDRKGLVVVCHRMNKLEKTLNDKNISTRK